MKQFQLKKVAAGLVVLALAWGANKLGLIDLADDKGGSTAAATTSGSTSARAGSGEAQIADAFRAKRSGFMVEVTAKVKRSLPDDREGSQHQRFILKLTSGATVLVAHNIDLAPRVPLREGSMVTLKGQYEWSEEGGVLHWTHGDPDGRHEAGWIEFEGKRYQ